MFESQELVKMEQVTLTTREFKALASENRTKILKMLQQQNHTLSEVSKKLGLSGPTAKQHLEILTEAELIELKDEGRKWKYYALTKNGKKILESKETQTQVFILLSIASIAFIGILLMLFSSIALQGTSTGPESETIKPPTIEPLQNQTTQQQPAPTAPSAGQAQKDYSNDQNAQKNTGQNSGQNAATPSPQNEPANRPQIPAALIALAAISGTATIFLSFKYFRFFKVKN